MRATIRKEFTFSAAHVLYYLKATQPDHPCARMHGHNYIVALVLRGVVDPDTGFVRDYRSLDEFKRWIDDRFDHRLLNDVILTDGVRNDGVQTTAENLAAEIFTEWASRIAELDEVHVSETPKTWAIVTRKDLEDAGVL